MLLSKIRVLLLGVIVAGVLSGCATSQPKETRRYFWPRLPERPRIEWLKNYANDTDLPKGGMNQFMTTVLGDDTSIALDRPLDIVVNSKKQIIIADPGVRNVVVFDLLLNNVHLLTRGDSKEYQLKQPVSLALGKNDTLYVADMDSKKVFVFDDNGKFLKSFLVQPNLTNVGGMAADLKNDRLYIADTRGHKIGIFDLQGKFISSFGKVGEGDGEFNYPSPLRLNRFNELLVGDTMNSRVQIFDSNGKFLRKFGNRGDGPQDFQVLKGIAIDSEDNIYVTDGKAHKVVIYNNKGDFLLSFGGLYSSALTGKESMGGFVLPQGIFIDSNDKLYVVDQINHRFQTFQYLSDVFLKANPIEGYDPNYKFPQPKGK